MENNQFTINYDPSYYNPRSLYDRHTHAKQAEMRVDTIKTLSHQTISFVGLYGRTVASRIGHAVISK